MTTLLLFLLAQATPQAEPKDLYGDPLPPDAAVRLGRVEFGHARFVYGLDLSADDKTLATGGPDGSIRIWDPANGRLRRLIPTGWIMSLAISPDGRIVASAASHDKRIRFHEVETGRELDRSVPIDDTTAMTWSPDGSLIAASGPRSEVRIWRVATSELVHDLKGFTGRAMGVAFADGGKRFVAGGDKEIRIWDVGTGKEIKKLEVDRPPLVIKSRPDSPVVAVTALTAQDGFLGPGTPEGPDANAITLIDTSTGEVVRKLKGPEQVVYAMALSRDGKALAASSPTDKSVIHVWDTATGEIRHRLEGHKRNVMRLTFTSDVSRLISAGEDTTIRIWDLATGKDITPGPRGAAPTMDLAWSPDSQTVATAGMDGFVRLWEAKSGRELAAFKAHDPAARSVAYSPDGSHLATGGDDRNVRIWTAATRETIRTIGPMENPVTSVAFGLDGKSIYAAGLGFVGKWNSETGAEVFREPVAKSYYARMVLSPDGRTLAVAEGERRVRLLDAADGTDLLSVARSGGPGVAFLRDRPQGLAWLIHAERVARLDSTEPWKALRRGGRPLELTCEENSDNLIATPPPEIRGWSVNVKKEHRHSDIGGTWQGLDASADGRWVAVGMYDGTLRLIETVTWKEVRRFRYHHYATLSVAFSPDGTRLASSCGAEPFALIWNLYPEVTYKKDDAAGLWTALDGADAFRALAAFSRGGDEAASFLADRLKLSSDDRAAGVVAELDNDDLSARDKAQKDLREMGLTALSALHQAIAKGAAGEMLVRIKVLIEELEGPALKNSDVVRRLRAIQILDQIGTPAAMRVLETLAKDSPSHRERAEAARTLKRLKR